MTMTPEEANGRRVARESNARIVLALSVLRGHDWCCAGCRVAADQADSALLGATVADLEQLAGASAGGTS